MTAVVSRNASSLSGPPSRPTQDIVDPPKGLLIENRQGTRREAKSMRKFVVTVVQEIEADTPEEAALLMYQSLTVGPAPLAFLVRDDTNSTLDVRLDQSLADEFAASDHTADPGNW
jgi:hypothetical protein